MRLTDAQVRAIEGRLDRIERENPDRRTRNNIRLVKLEFARAARREKRRKRDTGESTGEGYKNIN